MASRRNGRVKQGFIYRFRCRRRESVIRRNVKQKFHHRSADILVRSDKVPQIPLGRTAEQNGLTADRNVRAPLEQPLGRPQTLSSLLTSANFWMTNARSSGEWAAEICVRIRALP